MNTFKIEKRDMQVKPSFMRKNGNVPGTIYGATIKSAPVTATLKELVKVTSQSGEIYEVSFEGEKHFAKLFELQRNPLTHQLIHFSLVEMPKGVSNDLDIPLVFTGSSLGEKEGGSIVQLRDFITVNGMPKDMPKEFTIDISGLKINDSITVADLKMKKTLKTDLADDETIIICKAQSTDSLEVEAETPTEVAGSEDTIAPKTEEK
jgi:large subunit ribosomal protein L25